jgi:hypothetical protein
MAIINTNPVTRIDDDTVINSTWIRIIAFSGEDKSEAPSDTSIQFAFYASKEKWNADFRNNIIKVVGIGNDNKLTLPYSRIENGVDIPVYWYTKLVEYLLGVFPTWSIDNISFDLDSPGEAPLNIE